MTWRDWAFFVVTLAVTLVTIRIVSGEIKQTTIQMAVVAVAMQTIIRAIRSAANQDEA